MVKLLYGIKTVSKTGVKEIITLAWDQTRWDQIKNAITINWGETASISCILPYLLKPRYLS